MKTLHTLLDSFLEQSDNRWQVKLRADWQIIMGDLSKRARLERINGTTLVIGVYDSHWMHELHALSRMILARVNNALTADYPADFMLTALRCVWVEQKAPRATKPMKVPEAPKKIRISQEIMHYADRVNSDELKQALLDFYVRCRQTS